MHSSKFNPIIIKLIATVSVLLVELERLPHGALYIECTHILPVLLQEGDQEIDGQVNVAHQLVLSHLHMTNSHS